MKTRRDFKRPPTMREVIAALHVQAGRKLLPVELEAVRARFWAKVDMLSQPMGCWRWIGATNSWGYGNFRVGRKVMRANRLAYLFTYGTIPDGMIVMHLCDNRRCCNPTHLRLGTQSENVHEEWNRYRKPAQALGLLVARTRRNDHA